MDNNNLTPKESFELINKAIANFKMNYKDNAKVFLLWGWTMSLASFTHFVILKILQRNEAHELIAPFSLGNWAVFIGGTFVILYFMVQKMHRSKKLISHVDNFINILLQVTGYSMFIAIFLCIKLDIAPPPVMLLIAGILTTTIGLVIKFTPLIIGGMSFFVFSIATAFVPNESILLFTGASIITGYLIPGYLLKSAK